MEAEQLTSRPVALAGTAATLIVAGAFIGASTNAVNGVVSPIYFRNVMKWEDVENISRAIVAQGILEGLVYGVLIAGVFTLVVGVVSKARCPYKLVASHLAVMVGAIYLCWVVGGLVAMGLAALSPEFYRRTFFRVPEEFGESLRYAWVGGSIWGGMFGGVLTLIIGSVLFAPRWRRWAKLSTG